MNQSEFEQRKAANLSALFMMSKAPDMKVIDLVELLLQQNLSSPVVIQVDAQRYSIKNVGVDNDGMVRIIASLDGR